MVVLGRWLRMVLAGACFGVVVSVLLAGASAAWLPFTGVEQYQWWVDAGARSDSGQGLIVRENRRAGMVRRAWDDRMVPPMGNHPGRLRGDAVLSPEARERFARDLGWGRLSALMGTPSAVWHSGFEEARGWPVPCMYWTATIPTGRSRPPLAWESVAFRGGVVLTPRARPITIADVRVFPWLPIWRGLCLNTLFFGGILVATVAAFRGVRQGLRRRRGRCPSCAYDLRRDLAAGCPECGWRRWAAGGPGRGRSDGTSGGPQAGG